MSRTVKIGKSRRKDGAAPLVSSSHAASDAAPVPVPTSPSLVVDVEDDDDVRADDELQLTPPSSKANKAIELMSRAVRTTTAAGDGDADSPASTSASASGSGSAAQQQPALAVDMSSIHPSLAHLTLEMGGLEEEEDVDIYTVNDLRREKAEEKRRRKAAEKQRRQREKEMRLKQRQAQSASASEAPSLSPSPSSSATAANGLKAPPPPAAAADARQRTERRFNAMWTAVVAVVIIIAAVLLWQYGGSDRLLPEQQSGSAAVANGLYILNLTLWTDSNCSAPFTGRLPGGYQLTVDSYTQWEQLSASAVNCTVNPFNSTIPVIKSGEYQCSGQSLSVREWTTWSDCRDGDVSQGFDFLPDNSTACNPGFVFTTDENGVIATRGDLYASFVCNATIP